jgi:hypothetical protein
MRQRNNSKWRFTAIAALLLLAGVAHASLGDRMPEFKECVKVTPSHILVSKKRLLTDELDM